VNRLRLPTCRADVLAWSLDASPVRWHVKVTARRIAQDFAHCLQDLVDVHFPHPTVISIVSDNLKTHTPAAWYATFPPAEACCILRKLDFHYTPQAW
jgi:hypothetical protein